MKWAAEADKRISRIPFFIRKRVKKRIEEEAKRRGCSEVTLAHVNAVQKQFLKNMEGELKGFRVETCFGPAGCKNRAVDDEHLAQDLEQMLAQKDILGFLKKMIDGPLKMHNEFKVTIADCPNGCSRPQISDVGIIGAAVPMLNKEQCNLCGQCEEVCKEGAILLDKDSGPKFIMEKCLYCGECIRACPAEALQAEIQGYRIMVGGRLGRRPKLAQELPGIYSHSEAVKLSEACVDLYMAECVNGERFGEVIDRTTIEPLLAKVGKR